MTELALPTTNIQTVAPGEIDALIKSGAFLPRLQVCGGTTDLVKTEKIRMGNIAIVYGKDKADDLGKEVPALAIVWRSKALRIPKDGSAPISYYDMNSVEFSQIVKDSKSPESQCMFGPEFLLWVPQCDSFATLFCSSWTARSESKDLFGLMNDGKDENGRLKLKPSQFLMKSKLFGPNAKKQTWHGPTFLQYSAPFQTPGGGWVEQYSKEVQTFLNPPKSVVEKDEPAPVVDGEERAR